jgi:glycosyltransferase involved in cell wall biosynthesis
LNLSILIDGLNKKTESRQPWSYARTIALELCKLGENVNIFTNRQPSTSSPSIFEDNIVLHQLPVPSLSKIDAVSLSLIKETKPNILYFFGNSLSGVYLPRLKEVDVPIILHISSVHYSFSDLRKLSREEIWSHRLHLAVSLLPGQLLVRKLNNKMISKITVPSNAVKSSLCKFGVRPQKIHVAPLAFQSSSKILDRSSNTFEARRSLNLPKEDFIITYLGSPNTIRGTDTLLQSARYLKKDNVHFCMLILSRHDFEEDDSFESYLQKLIRAYELGHFVKIVSGTLSKRVVDDYIEASNLLVFPFKIVQSEPPLSVLEALGLGKPVIVTNKCGLPELVTPDTGFLVKPNDPHGLANTIYLCTQNPDMLAKMGERAKICTSVLPSYEVLGRWTQDLLSQTTSQFVLHKKNNV